MASILEMLMRRYTGLFSYPVPIDEDYIASRIGVNVPTFRQLLYKMSLEHVIRYIPCDHATVLYLHHDRLRPKNLNLDPERYDLLKGSCESRIQKMIDYVQEEEVCRSSYLLEYFGQTDSDNCGTCDICRLPHQQKDRTDINDALKDYVLVQKGGRYCLSDISRQFGSADNPSSDIYLSALRILIDKGIVPPPVSEDDVIRS